MAAGGAPPHGGFCSSAVLAKSAAANGGVRVAGGGALADSTRRAPVPGGLFDAGPSPCRSSTRESRLLRARLLANDYEFHPPAPAPLAVAPDTRDARGRPRRRCHGLLRPYPASETKCRPRLPRRWSPPSRRLWGRFPVDRPGGAARERDDGRAHRRHVHHAVLAEIVVGHPLRGPLLAGAAPSPLGPPVARPRARGAAAPVLCCPNRRRKRT